MWSSRLLRLISNQRNFTLHIHNAKNAPHVFRQSNFEDENIPRITAPHAMVKKLDKLKLKKTLEEAANKRNKFMQKDVIILCKRKEFNHYKGQRYKDLSVKELASGGWKHKGSRGDYFTIRPQIENPAYQTNIASFSELGLDDRIVSRLVELGFETPTDIQSRVIPELLKGKSCHCAAETGNGKTFAYLLPIMQRILQAKMSNEECLNRPQAVIVAPSRELADQIYGVARLLADPLGINIDVKCGGRGTQRILREFEVRPLDLVIATPGILSKLLSNKFYSLNRLSIFALDEVDTLFDDSFSEKMIHIIKKLKWSGEKPVYIESDVSDSSQNIFMGDLQVVLAGATLPKGIKSLMDEIIELNTIEWITTPYLEHILPHLAQKFIRLGPAQKLDHLTDMLTSNVKNKVPTIVFCNNPSTVNFLSHYFDEKSIAHISFHGDMPEKCREGRFERYQSGEVDVMICTDLASRGLDTIRTKHVINYDFPNFISDYIHRSGRVGRVGSPRGCLVINFIAREWDVDLLWSIETSVRKNTELHNVNANIKRKLDGLYQAKMFQKNENPIVDGEM